jgi:5-formyltetrahydrofolate cyclo-ligase
MTLTKSVFRKKCIKMMENRLKSSVVYQNRVANNKILKILKNIKGKNILFYYPMRMEVDIRKSLLHLRKNNNIFLPFMENESFKIVPFRLPLQRKKFGIYEAGNSLKKINKIDIAIVPVVGVDGNLQRIGFGRGMYDRYFEKLKNKPYTIFVQPKGCITDKLICDHFDVKGDLLITADNLMCQK